MVVAPISNIAFVRPRMLKSLARCRTMFLGVGLVFKIGTNTYQPPVFINFMFNYLGFIIAFG